jgi:hypothetical protein
LSSQLRGTWSAIFQTPQAGLPSLGNIVGEGGLNSTIPGIAAGRRLSLSDI